MRLVIAKLKLLALVVGCWIVFALACLFAIPAFPVALMFMRFSYAGNVLKTQDKLLAALLGYRGDNTVSRECGTDPDSSPLCKRIIRAVRWFHPEHFDRYQKDQ